MDNVKCYAKVCSKIGLALILFYSFFTLSTTAVLSFAEEFNVGKYKLVSEILAEFLVAIAYFFSFAVAAFILRKMCKKLPSHRPIYTSFNIKKWVLPAIVAIIAINFTFSFVNSTMIVSLSPSLGVGASATDEMASRPLVEKIIFFALAILSTAIVPAICEEYLFRGGVLTELLPFGKTTAVIASAFLFGIMHQSPFQFLYTILMGIVIGYVYIKSKSIWACVLLHFMNNFVTVIEEYLPYFIKIDWFVDLFDLLIVLAGMVIVVVLLKKKSKEQSIEETGAFGVICECGMDHEELELDLPKGKKLRKFFSRSMIIFVVICMISIVTSVISYFGGFNILPF